MGTMCKWQGDGIVFNFNENVISGKERIKKMFHPFVQWALVVEYRF
jgi:hypothetical protein